MLCYEYNLLQEHCFEQVCIPRLHVTWFQSYDIEESLRLAKGKYRDLLEAMKDMPDLGAV